MKKKILSWLVVIAIGVSIVPISIWATVEIPTDVTDTDLARLDSIEQQEITIGGSYRLYGITTCSLKVATEEAVTLILENAQITSTSSPLELVDNANVTLVLKDGTTNHFTATGSNAGILVPESATLTIDKLTGEQGTGRLTVQGGNGSAGIGTSAASGYTDTRAAKGGDSTINYNYRNPTDNQGWGGTGGQGGRHGADAGQAGTVVINAGVLNITGGQGGAGIGGGMGAAGENGANGAGGGATYLNRWDSAVPGGWFGNGGGAGGTGGNGGKGGAGGAVTVNGGAVTVTGGKFTLSRNGKTVEVVPASIGGGAGGIGGNGGAGGGGGNSGSNQPGDRWAGAGGYGETGYMNYNGDGGSLTVNGGRLTAIGNVATGEENNRVGIQCAVAARDSGYGGGGANCRRMPGHGVAAVAPQNTQQPLQIQINASEDNIRFPSYDDATVLSQQPIDKNNQTLYEVTLTVRDQSKTNLDGSNTSVVPGARVEIAVNQDDAAAAYIYRTIADDDGKATLWLPAGHYTLSGEMVQKAGVGKIEPGNEVTFEHLTQNNQAETVLIGRKDYRLSCEVPLYITVAAVSGESEIKTPDNYSLTNTSKNSSETANDAYDIAVTGIEFERLPGAEWSTVTSPDGVTTNRQIYLEIGGVIMPALSTADTQIVDITQSENTFYSGGKPVVLQSVHKVGATNTTLSIPLAGNILGVTRKDNAAQAQFKVKYTVSAVDDDGNLIQG